MINIKNEPINEEYRNLLSFLSCYGNIFSIVIRNERNISNIARKILVKLSPFLISEESSSEWPGTKLLTKQAMVYKYVFNEESLKKLFEIHDKLYDWIHPNSPEDFCVYMDDIAIFVSISHEKDSFFLFKNNLDNEIIEMLKTNNIKYEIT